MNYNNSCTEGVCKTGRMCAGLTAIRPLENSDFLRMLAENYSFRSNFPISAKGLFRGIGFYNIKWIFNTKWILKPYFLFRIY